MNIYQNIQETLTVPAAAEFYGMKMDLHHRICCPCHHGTEPDMKLYTEYYYCPVCDETGDAIDLVAKFFKLTPAQAARKIAHDLGLKRREEKQDKPGKVLIFDQTALYRDQEDRCFRALRDYIRLMDGWKEMYAPQGKDEELDDHYVEACLMYDNIQKLMDFLLFGTDVQRLEAVHLMLDMGFIEKTEEYVEIRKKMEESDGDHTPVA